MNLTAYERGRKSPADHFPPDTRVTPTLRRFQAQNLPREERDQRRQLAESVRATYDTTADMARELGVTGSAIRQWLRDAWPVPDKRVGTLKHLLEVRG